MSERAETPAGPREVATPSRGRSIALYVLLVLAGLLLLLSAFAVWVNRVALNTGVFVDTSAQLIEDDAIREAVATRAVDELYASVDVQAEIEAQLPEDFKSLSGPRPPGSGRPRTRSSTARSSSRRSSASGRRRSGRRTRPSSRCSRAVGLA